MCAEFGLSLAVFYLSELLAREKTLSKKGTTQWGTSLTVAEG